MKHNNVVSDTKCITTLNEWLNSMQSLVSTCYHGKSIGLWKCWFFLVKSRLYAGCTTEKKGHPNPQQLPDGANYLHTQRPDGQIRWQPGVVSGSHLVTKWEFNNLCPMHKSVNSALSTHITQSILCLIFLMYVRTIQHLNYSGQESKKAVCHLRMWHTCDFETRSRSSNLVWIGRPQTRL